MRKSILICFVALITTLNACPQKPQVWMLGPMVHFNLSQKKMHPSFGIELSYWNYAHFPYSFDGGIEFERNKLRLYSEAQTGIGFLGISLGPVMEFRTDEHKLKAGVQGSFWANYIGGFDIRLRSTGGSACISPGLYFKLPVGIGAKSDGNYNHHHHHWDWDD